MKRSIAAVAASLLLPACAFGQAAAPGLSRIGAAAAVKGLVKAEAKGAVGRVIDSGKPLFLNDHVTTDKVGRLQVLLLDETVFTLGPNSDMVLDDFVYNPSDDSGRVAARVTKGVFRFVTGKVARRDPANMKVKLPVGTIGIRGTMAIGEADSSGSTVILLGPGSHGNSDENKGSITFEYNGVTRYIENPGDGVTCLAGQNPSKVGDLSTRTLELNELLLPSADAFTGTDDSSGGAATEESGESVARGLANGEGQQPDAGLDQTLINATFGQNGIARWDDVRSIESGVGSYHGVGVYTCTSIGCSGQQGSMSFNLAIDFGARTIGGGGNASQIQLNSPPISDNTNINVISFAGLQGTAHISLVPANLSNSNFSGTAITLLNSNGVTASEAQIDLSYSASDTAVGTMTGSR